ncbi:hypothetical protein HWV62_20736 [Athelia sp. TMB]|nr:hypothetical protein HWV62_20736 [Athelia sp. TMB]
MVNTKRSKLRESVSRGLRARFGKPKPPATTTATETIEPSSSTSAPTSTTPIPSQIESSNHSDAASDASSQQNIGSNVAPSATAPSERKDIMLTFTKQGLQALEAGLKFVPIPGLSLIPSGLLKFLQVYEGVGDNSEQLEKLRLSIQSFFDDVLVPIGSFETDVPPEMQLQIAKLHKTLEQKREDLARIQGTGSFKQVVLSSKITEQIQSAKSAVIDAIQTFTRGEMIKARLETHTLLVNNTLDRLDIAKADYLHASKDACTPDTRVDMRKTIIEHLNDSSNRFVWLKGSPGTGKTAISKSVAIALQEQGRLAASFYFEKTGASRFAHSTDRFSSTLAHQLANFHPPYRHALFCHLRARHGDYPPLPLAQLHELVIARLDEHPDMPFPPSVIVLDGLDECGGSGQTALEALMTLVLELAKLPSSIKFFIASRPERAISSAWSRHPQAKHIVIEDVDQIRVEENYADITKYVQESLSKIPDRGSPWPPLQEDVRKFVDQCLGIFEIARIRMRYLENAPPSVRMDEMFNALVQIRSSPAGVSRFAEEYLWILHRAFPSPDETRLDAWERDVRVSARARFRTVIGAVLAMRWPLRLNELSFLLQMEESNVMSVLSPLSSIVRTHESSPGSVEISFFHATCSEFLCGKFNEPGSAVDPVFLFEDTIGSILAAPCLDLLINQLQPGKMLALGLYEHAIAVCYASLSWAYHIDLSPQSPLSLTLLASLRPFLSQFLQVWLEFGWITSFWTKEMLKDRARKFLTDFSEAIPAIQRHLRSLLTEVRAEDLAPGDRWTHSVLLEAFGSWQGFEGLLPDSSGQQSATVVPMQSRLCDLVERVRQVQPDFKPHSLFHRASLKYPCPPALASETVVSNGIECADNGRYVQCSTISPQGRLALSFLDGSLQISNLHDSGGWGRHPVPASGWNTASLPAYVWLEFIVDGKRLIGEDVDGMVWVLDESGVINTFGPLPAPGPRTNAVASQDGMYLVRAPSQHQSHQSFSWYNQMVLLEIVGDEISWRTLASPTDVGEFPLLECIPRSLGFSPDGKFVGAFDERVAHIWSVHSAHHVERWGIPSTSKLIVNPWPRDTAIKPKPYGFRIVQPSQGGESSETPISVGDTLVCDIASIDDTRFLPRDIDSYVFVQSTADEGDSWLTFSRMCPDGTMFVHPKTGSIYRDGWQSPKLFVHVISPNERVRIFKWPVPSQDPLAPTKYWCCILIGGCPKMIHEDDKDANILFPSVFAMGPYWSIS